MASLYGLILGIVYKTWLKITVVFRKVRAQAWLMIALRLTTYRHLFGRVVKRRSYDAEKNFVGYLESNTRGETVSMIVPVVNERRGARLRGAVFMMLTRMPDERWEDRVSEDECRSYIRVQNEGEGKGSIVDRLD